MTPGCTRCDSPKRTIACWTWWARCVSSSCTSRSHAFDTSTPSCAGASSCAAALRTIAARADVATLRRVSGMPMGRSPGSPSAPSPPCCASRSRYTCANTWAAAAGTRVTAAFDTSSSTTPKSASCPPSVSDCRCSIRRPEGPGAVARGARWMEVTTTSRETDRGTVAPSPNASASARRSEKSFATDAEAADADAAGRNRNAALRQTAGACAAGSSDSKARAAALRRPAHTVASGDPPDGPGCAGVGGRRTRPYGRVSGAGCRSQDESGPRLRAGSGLARIQ